MPIPAEIEGIVDETPTIKTFSIRPAEPIPFEAGQFVQLTVPGIGEAPFTPSSSPSIADRMEITIVRVGRVTEALHELEPGARVGLRGPLGRPYPLDAFRDRDVVVIGGGCGVGPLRALLFALLEQPDRYGRILFRYGARTPEDVVYREACARSWGSDDLVDVLVTVDEGDDDWHGRVGMVTEILDEKCFHGDPSQRIAVMCGPPAMMRFATGKLLEEGYAAEHVFLSVERNMSCGVGLCGHCRVGPYYVCRDGPVFRYADLAALPRAWDLVAHG
ncbi:MAG: FAD/NAD(P)-binding protein [Myxococcota bacterium]|nr:FAD/NAD(P)-binding protein [Myxococcota bacterium]